MPGGQAKTLSEHDVGRLLKVANASRHPLRNKVIVPLSMRAGFRAGEIAKLEWSMLTDERGKVANLLELPGRVTKYGMAWRVPLHPELKSALIALAIQHGVVGPVIASERDAGGSSRRSLRHMTAKSIVNWFTANFRDARLNGCSSHSGRRTFVTRAARLVHKAGGSLRDVQQLVGHRSIETTQSYIDGDSDAQRKLVRML